jgi:hypothetical protein
VRVTRLVPGRDLDAAEIAKAWSRLDRVVRLLWPLTK